jgi:hypothetical protein
MPHINMYWFFWVPFWWVFGFLNTQQDTWIVSSQFENPTVGENVSFRLWGSTQLGFTAHNFWIGHSAVNIEPVGQKAYQVITNEDGIAYFVYTTDPTIIKSYYSPYYVVPAIPTSWLISCVFASVGAVVSGLLVRSAFLRYFNKKTNEQASFKPSVDNLTGP